MRDAAGKPTGVIKGDIAATRPVAARLPKVAPDQLEASSLALVKDMNRAGLTTFGVAGCNADVLEIFQKWKAQGRLNVRVFCIGGASAGSPEQVERSIPQIAQMKLYQGDEFIDNVVFGESVYTPLHDPMFALKSDPKPEQLALWRRMAMEIAKAGLPLHVHAELHNTIDAFLDQIEAVNKEYPIKNLRWALAHVNQINASQLERMKKLGMYAAVHPWAVINGGIMHEGFGDGAFDMPPLATIQNSGISWGFGIRRHRRQSDPAVHDAVFCGDRQDARRHEGHPPDDQPRGRADRAHPQECVPGLPGGHPRLDPAGQAGRPGGAGSRLPDDSRGSDQGHQAGDDDGRRANRLRRRNVFLDHDRWRIAGLRVDLVTAKVLVWAGERRPRCTSSASDAHRSTSSIAISGFG